MRLLITEEALELNTGHWPNYIGGLTSAFREQGDEVQVLTHSKAMPEVLSHVNGTPWYSRNCWRDSRSQGKMGGLIHNYRFYRESSRFVRQNRPFDRILALTVRMQHLLAFAALSRSHHIPTTTRFVLLFVQGFGRFTAPGQPTNFPRGFSNRLAQVAFRLMARNVRKGRVILAGETAGMCEELTRFTGLPTTLFPHPVRFPELPKQHFASAASSHKEVATIACPGFARHEKGSDILHDAISKLLAANTDSRYRFILQWPDPFELPSGAWMNPEHAILNDPRVEFLNDALSPQQYDDMLERSDFVILPYRASSYHHRLSRVAIEAAGKGIPLIYTAHTWTQEIADLVGGGIRIEAENVDAIIDAIQLAFRDQLVLKKLAQAGAPKVREFHSAATFRKLLA